LKFFNFKILNKTKQIKKKKEKWDHKELRKKNADPSLVSEDEKFQCLFRAVQNKHKISTLVRYSY